MQSIGSRYHSSSSSSSGCPFVLSESSVTLKTSHFQSAPIARLSTFFNRVYALEKLGCVRFLVWMESVSSLCILWVPLTIASFRNYRLPSAKPLLSATAQDPTPPHLQRVPMVLKR